MALKYTLIIKTSEPTNAQQGWFWVNPTTGQSYIADNNASGNWVPMVSDYAISTYIEGIYWKTAAIQGTVPSGEIGLLWFNSTTKQQYIFLNNWIPC